MVRSGRGVGVGDVAYVQDDVGLGDLLQRGAERRDQLGRQLGYESYRIGQDDLTTGQ